MALFQKDDPKDEIKMQLAQLSVKLADVRKQVGELSAEYRRIKPRYDDAGKQSSEYAFYAKKALKAGNQGDARVFLEEKYKYDQKLEQLGKQLENVYTTRRNAMELHDKMVREINEAKARLAVLEARETAADVSLDYSRTAGSSGFEEKLSGLEAESELEQAMRDAKSYVDDDKWGGQ